MSLIHTHSGRPGVMTQVADDELIAPPLAMKAKARSPPAVG